MDLLPVPVWMVATRLGMKEEARALDTLRGMLVIVSYCPFSIPRREEYSLSAIPWADMMLETWSDPQCC